MNRVYCRLGLGLAALAAFSSRAQVTNVAIFKVTVYHQTNTLPPVAPNYPNAYYFGAQLNMTVADYYQVADVLWQGAPPSSPATNLALPFIPDYNFSYSVPYYATKASFDADFGPGTYEFDGTDTNTATTDSAYVVLPVTEYYPTNVPAFPAESWQRMQKVDPAKDLSLNLNSFGVLPGANEALVFINVFDPNNFAGPVNFNTNGVSLALTNFTIPANSLLYGVNYEADVYFSSRLLTSGVGFGGAEGIVGFDDLAFATIATVPPPLWISRLGKNVAVSWPSLASNFNLVTSTNLASPFGWQYLTNIVQAPGLTNTAILAATDTARFYRLTSLAP